MQLNAFCLMLLFGAFTGFVYEPLRAFRPAGKGGILVRCFLDVVFCLLVGAGYVALALEFLSGFRFFHLLGMLCGLLLYEKSFHKTVAFFGKMVYNAHVKVIRKQKDRALWKQRNNPSPRKKPRGSQ